MESALEAMNDEPRITDGETLYLRQQHEEDVEMADAEALLDDATTAAAGDASRGNNKKKKRTGKKRRSGKKKHGGEPTTIADINRFVLDACRRLREKKSYLVWNAVGCLGVSAVNDLVKEVDAIQRCGGQKTANGSRFRNGGGILWNILKSREPKAYKEIMAKGRELEKQFRQMRTRQWASRKEDKSSQSSILAEEEIEEALDEKEVLDDPGKLADVQVALPSDDKSACEPVVDRIRVPVAYDDLFEEGEIHEEA